MIKFHASTPADKIWVDELLVRGNYRGCNYNFINLCIWSRAYNQCITRVDSLLVIHAYGRPGCSYMHPADSEDIVAVIRALEVNAAEKGEPLRPVCFTLRQMVELEEFFPGRFVYTADWDGYGYLYEMERLVGLGGRKLHAKRNHINCSVENDPTWTYEETTSAILPECLEADKKWCCHSLQRGRDAEKRDLGDEGIALYTAMEHYEELGLKDGLIRVYGKVMALTTDDRLSADTYDVHSEKAYGEPQGTYAMISQELTRWAWVRHPEIRYLSREDDTSMEGLRRAEQNYYPDLMVEKYTAVVK